MSDTKHDGTNEGALWGARFASGPAPELAALSRSTHFDWVLAPYDIAGSYAHAAALAAAGYLTPDEEQRMHAGLDALSAAIADGTLVAQPGDEDVHGALEAALIAEVGPDLGGRLRAGEAGSGGVAARASPFFRGRIGEPAGQGLHLSRVVALHEQRHDGGARYPPGLESLHAFEQGRAALAAQRRDAAAGAGRWPAARAVAGDAGAREHGHVPCAQGGQGLRGAGGEHEQGHDPQCSYFDSCQRWSSKRCGPFFHEMQKLRGVSFHLSFPMAQRATRIA